MNSKEKVFDILKDFRATMFVTKGSGKPAEARPMQIAKLEDGGDLWFFTSSTGHLIEEIAEDSSVLLTFQDSSAYVSLRGRARLVQDRARVKEIWQEPYKVWFPGGVNDPDLALLAVDPVSAEYWDNRGMNKMEYLFEAAKAYVKGETPDLHDADQHAKVAM